MTHSTLRFGRNQTLRSVVASMLAAGLVAALSACAPQANSVQSDCTAEWEFPTVQRGAISVAAVNNPPMINIDPNTGKAEGLEVDILEGFAAAVCLPLKFNSVTGAAAVAAMSGGKMDIGAGGWGITEERGETIGQLDEPTVYNPPAILSNQGIATIAEINGVAIGVEGGSLYQTKLEELFGKDNVKSYQSVDAAVQDMVAGRIQATYGDSTQMAQAAEANGLDLKSDLHLQSADPEFTELTAVTLVNLPFTKSNTKLGTALNEYVAGLRKSGELTSIVLKWGLTEGNATGKF